MRPVWEIPATPRAGILHALRRSWRARALASARRAKYARRAASGSSTFSNRFSNAARAGAVRAERSAVRAQDSRAPMRPYCASSSGVRTARKTSTCEARAKRRIRERSPAANYSDVTINRVPTAVKRYGLRSVRSRLGLHPFLTFSISGRTSADGNSRYFPQAMHQPTRTSGRAATLT